MTTEKPYLPSTLERFKSLAKRHGRESNIPHRLALESFAALLGFKSYYEVREFYSTLTKEESK